MDYSKFDRVPQYNLFLQAVLQFREENGGKLPTPRNQADAEKVLSFAKAINEKRTNDKVDEVNDKLIIQLAQTARGDLSPMATIFGGIVAQEVIKGTAAKYSPIDQWFLYESLGKWCFIFFFFFFFKKKLDVWHWNKNALLRMINNQAKPIVRQRALVMMDKSQSSAALIKRSSRTSSTSWLELVLSVARFSSAGLWWELAQDPRDRYWDFWIALNII